MPTQVAVPASSCIPNPPQGIAPYFDHPLRPTDCRCFLCSLQQYTKKRLSFLKRLTKIFEGSGTRYFRNPDLVRSRSLRSRDSAALDSTSPVKAGIREALRGPRITIFAAPRKRADHRPQSIAWTLGMEPLYRRVKLKWSGKGSNRIPRNPFIPRQGKQLHEFPFPNRH